MQPRDRTMREKSCTYIQKLFCYSFRHILRGLVILRLSNRVILFKRLASHYLVFRVDQQIDDLEQRIHAELSISFGGSEKPDRVLGQAQVVAVERLAVGQLGRLVKRRG